MGKRLIWVALGLAVLAALAYVLIAAGVLSTGDLSSEEGPAGIVFVSAGCYLVGGLLILLRRRWLWVVGGLINALVIFTFISFYLNRPAVLFSSGGVATKFFQILLEVALIALIFTYRSTARGKQAAS